ncbi:MAG TPA: hypothetical protein VFQ15_11275, partial [Jiangellaceae bacterium]|nr:hypothetical protein [Jiangellaceae bacterium]
MLCTANVKDFPVQATSDLGLKTLTPDELLIAEFPEQMLAVHETSVASLRGATDGRPSWHWRRRVLRCRQPA